MFGFSSKKRPNSLIIGRTFDNEAIDMFELNIEGLKLMEDFKVMSSSETKKIEPKALLCQISPNFKS